MARAATGDDCVRGHSTVRIEAYHLTRKEADSLVREFGGTARVAKPLTARDAALTRTGQSLYRGGDATAAVPACSACHLPNGGVQPVWQ